MGNPKRRTQTPMVILVTGSVGAGKTTLLMDGAGKLKKARWQTGGFCAIRTGTSRPGSKAAPGYHLKTLDDGKIHPWATRQEEPDRFPPFIFNEETLHTVSRRLMDQLDLQSHHQDNHHNQAQDPNSPAHDTTKQAARTTPPLDVLFIDEIGMLELQGKGFAPLLKAALNSSLPTLVLSMRKDTLACAIETFAIPANHLLLDLDNLNHKLALHLLLGRVKTIDSEKVGTYAAVSGLMEIGLGATLHAYRVPMKGSILCYLQNMLLITFGKNMGGRNLIPIAFISGMLKAFSPMGARLRPMIFIFLQGLFFALPGKLFGWNLLTVLVGSIIMAWINLGFSLGTDYLIFGRSIFDAYLQGITVVLKPLSIGPPTLMQVFWVILAFKGILAVILATIAWKIDLRPWTNRFRTKARARKKRKIKVAPSPGTGAITTPLAPQKAPSKPNPVTGFLQSARDALRDMARPRLVLSILLPALLILFLTDLNRLNYSLVLLRGLTITWLGLTLARRFNPAPIMRWLHKGGNESLAQSLQVALATANIKTAGEEEDSPDTLPRGCEHLAGGPETGGATVEASSHHENEEAGGQLS